MALVIADRVLETTVTTGTGALALGGAITGHRAFDDVCANNDTAYYSIFAVDGSGNPSGDWEAGLGTFTDTDTLTRTEVHASSNANAAVNFAAGTKYVMLAATAAHLATFAGAEASAPFSGIVSGLGVAYTGSNLDFEMAAGSYYIAGTLYSAAQQTISLAAADGSNPRIDVLYVDTAGLLGKITGIPGANPSQPQVDPTTQLLLNFVLVPTAATSLSGITNVNIYLEDTEWTTTTSGSGFTKNSTNNPYAGTTDIEGTNVTAASYIKLVSTAISFDGDGNLTFRIRSKATWNQNRWLTFQWFLSGVAKGQPVSLTRTSFGFNSAQTSTYQYIVIPKSFFAIPTGTNVDELRIVDVGGAIGFYIDNIILQTNGVTVGGGGTGLTQAQADARYAQLAVANTFAALQTLNAGANMTPAAVPSTTAVGYLGSPQMSDQDAYTLVMSDSGKHHYHVSGSAHTVTIPANASVAFPIGTILTFINENGGGDVTIAITTDTLRWGTSTGSRTLAADGVATAIKVTSTLWRLTGDGIS